MHTFKLTYSDSEKSSITYASDENEDIVIHLYKPIKKDSSGIWFGVNATC